MTDVSSTASCSNAPASVMSSRPRSERIIATPSGCAMYGSPERRTWSRCASRATSYASSISSVSRSVVAAAHRREQRAQRAVDVRGRPGGAAAGSAAGASHSVHQRVDRVARRSGSRPCEEPELEHEREADDLAAEPLDQPGGRGRGAAGRDHVVDDRTCSPGRDRVAVDLEQVGAVLELVLLALDLPRQLARACGPARTRRCSPYATGAANTNPRASIPMHLVDPGRRRTAPPARRPSPGTRRAPEQRRDVLEDDPRLRIVEDVAHVRLQPGRIHRYQGTAAVTQPPVLRRRAPSYLRFRPRCWRGRAWIGAPRARRAGRGTPPSGLRPRRRRRVGRRPGRRTATRPHRRVATPRRPRATSGARRRRAAFGRAPGTAARAPSTTPAAARRRRSTSTNR